MIDNGIAIISSKKAQYIYIVDTGTGAAIKIFTNKITKEVVHIFYECIPGVIERLQEIERERILHETDDV